MRVISSFKDYYDVCQGFGQDPKLIYVRETKEFEVESMGLVVKNIKDRELRDIAGTLFNKLPPHSETLESGLIVFCGIAYPFHVLEGQVLYSREKLIEAAKKYKPEYDFQNEVKNRMLCELGIVKKKGAGHYYQPRLGEQNWKKYEQEVDLSVSEEIHLYFNAPILLVPPKYPRRVVANPILKPWKFVTILDPYSAYQELSMYVGNNMVIQRDPNPPIPDKVRAESKGFDNWSFRKHKDDSKKPRKRKK